MLLDRNNRQGGCFLSALGDYSLLIEAYASRARTNTLQLRQEAHLRVFCSRSIDPTPPRRIGPAADGKGACVTTLITVHGTFASGPENGDAWWQRGSEFDARLRGFVATPKNRFEHVPFVWSGLNSERDRRKAAEALLARFRLLEAEGGDYAVIGHSHGGSVIASALFAAAAAKESLPHLKLWMTIGTPFISHVRERRLFSRLSTFGKAGYMVVMYLLFTLISFLGYTYIVENDYTFGDLLFVLPFLLLYSVLHRLQITDKRLYSDEYRRRAREYFEERWLGLHHQNDEAIQGLGSPRTKRIDVFPEKFAVPTLSLASLFVMPLILILIASSPSAMQAIVSFAQSLDPRTDVSFFRTDETGTPAFVKNGFLLLALPAYVSLSYFEALDLSFSVAEGLSIVTTLLVLVAIYWAVSLVILRAVTFVAGIVSFLLSRHLNVVTWNQIRRSALGGDLVGETEGDVATRPFWIQKPARPLPDYVSSSLAGYSNRHAAGALAKFRDALNTMAFQEPGGDSMGTISQYLTWRELIHTSYFYIPEFQTLTACALCRSEAFVPTDALKQAPEFARHRGWLDQAATRVTDLPRPS